MRYAVHGLAVESDLSLPPLPVLPSKRAGELRVAVRISQGDLPDCLEAAEVVRPLYQSAAGEVLMHAPGVGRIHVVSGDRIRYQPASADREDELAAHILGSGFAILHQQRGNVVLHASSVVRGGFAFLLCGPSGSGKSTIAAHLLAGGASTLGDDVCLVGDEPDFLVHPGPPSTKLAADALAALPDFAKRPRQGICQSGKSIIGTLDLFCEQPVPLAGIFMLTTDQEDTQVAAQRLTMVEGLALLRQNTFRKRCMTRSDATMLFPKWCALARAVPIWRIGRPVGCDTQQQIVDMIEHLSQEAIARRVA